MTRETDSGIVIFRCPVCRATVEGSPDDAKISGELLGSGETADKYHRLIRNASADRTNQLVRKLCNKCGLDYMTQIRVGDAEVIVHTCKCGATYGHTDLKTYGGYGGYGMSDAYSLNMDRRWFELIREGKKSIEGRRGNYAKFANWIGKDVIISPRDSKDAPITVTIVDIQPYPDLATMLKAEPLDKLLPGVTTIEKATEVYQEFYTDSSIMIAGGMVALYLRIRHPPAPKSLAEPLAELLASSTASTPVESDDIMTMLGL